MPPTVAARGGGRACGAARGIRTIVVVRAIAFALNLCTIKVNSVAVPIERHRRGPIHASVSPNRRSRDEAPTLPLRHLFPPLLVLRGETDAHNALSSAAAHHGALLAVPSEETVVAPQRVIIIVAAAVRTTAAAPIVGDFFAVGLRLRATPSPLTGPPALPLLPPLHFAALLPQPQPLRLRLSAPLASLGDGVCIKGFVFNVIVCVVPITRKRVGGRGLRRAKVGAVVTAAAIAAVVAAALSSTAGTAAATSVGVTREIRRAARAKASV